jgi:integrase
MTLGYFSREGAAEHLSLKDARNRLDEIQAAHREHRLQEVLGGAAGAPKTVEELAELFYGKRIVPHRRRPEVVRDVLDRDILPRIGKRSLAGFSTAACRWIVEEVVSRGATTYAGRVLQVLKQLGRYGVGNSYLSTNPASPLEPKQLGVVAEGSERFLTRSEIVAWWHALDESEMTPTVRNGLRLLLFTGLRTAELLKQRWADVNLDGEDGPTLTIPVENQKVTKEAARKARPFVVPLAPPAVEVLRELKGLAGRSPWVMASEDAAEGRITDKALGLAMRRLWRGHKTRGNRKNKGETRPPLLTIPPASPHDLRHTMKTHYNATLGIEPWVAERALNHSLGPIFKRYTHDDFAPKLRDAALRWADYVTRIVRGEDAKVIGIGGRA